MNITLKKINLAGLTLISAFVLLLTSTAAIAPANPDFSGNWVLNESKSDLGQFGARMARKLTITADANGLTSDRTINGQNGEMKMTDKLAFDGKETESTFFGENKKKSTAKWSADGQSLAVNWVAAFENNGDKMEIKGAETWKLSDGGATLTIESTSTSSYGTFTTKCVYDKAK